MQISLAELKNIFCFSFKQISICLVIKDNKWIVDESFIGVSAELMPKDSPFPPFDKFWQWNLNIKYFY